SLEAYNSIFKDGNVLLSLKNTVVITLFGTAFNMLFTIMCAYPLSRKRLQGRGFFSGIIVFTMIFGGGLIPSFLLVKSLKLINTYWALWLPGLISVYNMIILKTFFQGIPDSLEEAAMIDGANDIYILVRIMLPLSGSVLATLSLFSAVGWWNDYYNSMIYLDTTTKLPMTVRLMQMISNANRTFSMNGEGVDEYITPEAIKASTIVVTMVPILCVYPFLQKYFVKGVMIGSVKG
ncbi:MAG: carbohydrate ABC transporter permease, partial [Firmicutes bacterium]|nr:carbohydrate ABC transporter permease [Bacillota bacterium]